MQEQCFVRLKLGQREEQRLSQVDEVCRTPYKSSLLEVRRHGGGSTAESKMEMLSVLLLCILLRAYDTEG